MIRRTKGLINKVLECCCCQKQQHLPPEGYFTVYVGPARERFMVRTESVNHPLFQRLLDAAEGEYGYCTPGPLELPCTVDIFRQVLSEMEQEAAAAEMTPRCSLMIITRAHSGYRDLFIPARPMAKIELKL